MIIFPCLGGSKYLQNLYMRIQGRLQESIIERYCNETLEYFYTHFSLDILIMIYYIGIMVKSRHSFNPCFLYKR